MSRDVCAEAEWKPAPENSRSTEGFNNFGWVRVRETFQSKSAEYVWGRGRQMS